MHQKNHQKQAPIKNTKLNKVIETSNERNNTIIQTTCEKNNPNKLIIIKQLKTYRKNKQTYSLTKISNYSGSESTATYWKNNKNNKQHICSNYSGSEPKNKNTWENKLCLQKKLFKLVWLKGPMARLV